MFDLKFVVAAALVLGCGTTSHAQVGTPKALPAEAIVRFAVDPNPPAKRKDPGHNVVVAVSPDSKFIATGENFIVRVFERVTGKPVRSFPAEPHQIMDLAFTPDGKGLLVAIAYHPARLWDLDTGKEKQSFKGSMGSVRGVMRFALNHDATRLALAVNEPAIQLVSFADDKLHRKLGEKQMIDRVAFAPDGKTLAGGGFNQKLTLWNADTGQEMWVAPNGSSIVAVAFAPDGKHIATGDYSALKLWDAQAGKIVRTSPLGFTAVRTVAFSPNGRYLAAAGDSKDAVLFDATTGVQLRRLTGHDGQIWSLAFSPDGQTLVTGSHDASAIVWDISGRRFVIPLKGPATEAALNRLWTEMGRPDGLIGNEAQWQLTLLDDKAVAFLDKQMRIMELPNAVMLAKHIAALDDEEFAVREAAMTALAKLGKSATPELRRALTMNPSAEKKGRLETLLRATTDSGIDPRLRAQRALAALEAMTAPASRELLQHLADKETDAEVRRDAVVALRRIKVRAASDMK